MQKKNGKKEEEKLETGGFNDYRRARQAKVGSFTSKHHSSR